MIRLEAAGSYVARWFPTGGLVDICGNDMKVRSSHRVILSVWRSDGKAVVYVDA